MTSHPLLEGLIAELPWESRSWTVKRRSDWSFVWTSALDLLFETSEPLQLMPAPVDVDAGRVAGLEAHAAEQGALLARQAEQLVDLQARLDRALGDLAEATTAAPAHADMHEAEAPTRVADQITPTGDAQTHSTEPAPDRCRNGHALTGDNVYISKGGWRKCRQCKREANDRYRARKGHTPRAAQPPRERVQRRDPTAPHVAPKPDPVDAELRERRERHSRAAADFVSRPITDAPVTAPLPESERRADVLAAERRRCKDCGAVLSRYGRQSDRYCAACSTKRGQVVTA